MVGMAPFCRKTTVAVQARNRVLFHPAELAHLVVKPSCTTPLQVQATPIQPGTQLLLPSTDARTIHLRNVLNAKPGDTIKVGIVNGPAAAAQVLSTHGFSNTNAAHDVLLAITELQETVQPTGVDLLLVLPRPKVLKRLWPVIAELGVGCVILTNAARVEKTYWAAGAALDPEQMQLGFIKGLEQAGCTQLPEVVISKTFKGALLHLEQRAHVRSLQRHQQCLQQQKAHALPLEADTIAGHRQEAREKPKAEHRQDARDREWPEAPEQSCTVEPYRITSRAGEACAGIAGKPIAGSTGPCDAVHAGKGDADCTDQYSAGECDADFQNQYSANQRRVTSKRAVPALPWGVSYLVGRWDDYVPSDMLFTNEQLHAPSWQAMVDLNGRVADGCELRVVGHPYVDTPVLQVLQHGVQACRGEHSAGSIHRLHRSPGGLRNGCRVVVAVGPEGGWWPDELQMLCDVGGFVPASLGPRILTSTTAVVTLVGCANQVLLQH